MDKVPVKKKRGRKPKNNIIINDNPVFESNENPALVIKLEHDCENKEIKNEKNNKLNDINNDINNNINNDVNKNTSEVCWNCCHNFYKNIVGLPIKVCDNMFHTIGDFCSLECACRYALDNYENNYFEILSLINYYNIQMNNKNIIPAKSKLELIKFGGKLTIQEYRKYFQNENINNIEPLVKQITFNNDYNFIKNNNLNNLKLFRKKLLNDNDNSISKIMKLEINQ